jgi:hypothetical protein
LCRYLAAALCAVSAKTFCVARNHLRFSAVVREFTWLKLTAMTDIKQLLKEFERFAYGQSLSGAFTEMLDWFLLPFKKWETVELQNTALETYKSHSKVNQLVKLITLIGDLSEGFCDPLGELLCKQFQMATMDSISLLSQYAI